MSNIKKHFYIPNPRAKAATPLQVLSSKRNWDLLQIKGAVGNLSQQIINSSLPADQRNKMWEELDTIRYNLETALDKKWKANKEAFRKAVEAEAFDHNKLDSIRKPANET